MMYACLKYRNYRIKHLQFKNGLLVVDKVEDKELVEGNDFYGAHIFPVPEPEEEKSNGKEDGESKDDKPEVAEGPASPESQVPGKRQTPGAAKKGVGRGRKGGVRKGKKEPVR